MRPAWTTPWSVTRALAVRFGGTAHVPPAALKRGTMIHEWTAAVDRIRQRGVGDEPAMPLGLEGYCYAYQDVIDTMKPTWFKVESPVEHARLGYHGILDRYGYLKGGSILGVADIKTGGPRKADRYQLAAYAMAFNASLPVTGFQLSRVGIYIRDDGTWSLKTYDDPIDYSVWLEILNEAKETTHGKDGTRQDGPVVRPRTQRPL